MSEKITIRKGTHAPFRFPQLLIQPRILKYRFMFTDSCLYEIDELDQPDVNKLFGIGYFPGHKIHSVRVGWRYDLHPNSVIELMAYWRMYGRFQFKILGYVPLNEWINMEILQGEGNHIINVQGMTPAIVSIPPQPVGYLLRPYFGGNQTAPHDMTIHMERL